VSFFGSLWTAIEVGRRETKAVDAAIAAGKAGATPLGMLRAFAADNPALPPVVLMELERGMRDAIWTGHELARLAAKAILYEPIVSARLLDLGYLAQGMAARLQTWLDEPPPT
jgi:hypothetical protein